MKPTFSIPYYHDYISPTMAEKLLARAKPVDGVKGLVQVGEGGGLETKEALQFLVDVYSQVEAELKKVLKQRQADRQFIDERVSALYQYNQEQGRDLLHPDYKTVIGLEDSKGRIVFGPLNDHYAKPGGDAIAPIPEFLKGPHVTLFGPPDSAKMAINAMNAFHRKLKEEPAIVAEILKTQDSPPKWGADDEDSKTPLRSDLIDAAVNLTGCFEGTISLKEESSGKQYDLAKDHLALPIKRFPGLALPSTFLFLNGNPIPLHLYDFALHLYRNWNNPKALAFYVPKLENEEEAKYIHSMIKAAEDLVKKKNPSYVLGSVRLMIVLENPRAIVRAHEIMNALYPYFVGASLGWHDYLASTARLFKNDGNYRIPVKADPYIVIKYIKASHNLLADVVGSRGGIQVGGMYGVLPLTNELHSPSFQITIMGFIKDVITQMKRNLTGFWVAHPDFVRIGLALVEAWKQSQQGNKTQLTELVKSLLNPEHHAEILQFIEKPDIEGLNLQSPQYVRSLIVADMKESDYIANNHPDEIRYNVFQSLQYLTDWLTGNGCVALPSQIAGVPVRVMDDLATAERSRWEVWHEIHHGRFSVEDFIKIAFEEMNFIRRNLSDDKKIVQVEWNERTEKWYPIALKLMVQLMTAQNPCEFATELLMPFTDPTIRQAQDPWKTIREWNPGKYDLSAYVERLCEYYEVCGSQRFAKTLAVGPALDLKQAESIVMSFSVDEIIEAASFHGNIGESKKSLDGFAKQEQALVFGEEEQVKVELARLGAEYWKKFGFKFLISAKGRSGKELLEALKARIDNPQTTEIENARKALWEISLKRFQTMSLSNLVSDLENLRRKYNVTGASIAISTPEGIQTLCLGDSDKKGTRVTEDTSFEIASLSKTFASAFACEYFSQKKISLSTSVNELLAKTPSKFRVPSAGDSAWTNEVTIEHLMNHQALNMHYVSGYPLGSSLPDVKSEIRILHKPGTVFQYSGGGFIVLEHLIESLEGKSIQELTKPFFQSLGLTHTTFELENRKGENYAHGYLGDQKEVPTTRLKFPAMAAGALGTAKEMTQFLQKLTNAFHDGNATKNISHDTGHCVSHDTAVNMLFGTDKGCQEFMASKMGLGVFIAEAGDNRLAIHQGANEGFRCIYLHCFDGPDKNKGLTILCNADVQGVLFNAEATQLILKALNMSGIDFSKFSGSFDFSKTPKEQIVNMGYKNLVFNAFEPMLPVEILEKGPKDPWASKNLLLNAEVVSVTNQKFARATNLFSDHLPIFDPELFCYQGKVMDSWETARHNPLEFDTLVLKLKKSSQTRFVRISTMYHDGNQVEFVRLWIGDGKNWQELLPKTQLAGHSHIEIDFGAAKGPFTHLRVDAYPDGGLSRLSLYESLPADEAQKFKPLAQAKNQRFEEVIPKTHKPLTLPFHASEIGEKLLKATNEHYGPAIQVLSPYPPIHMFDGLESARSRKPGHHEEVTIELEKPKALKKIVMDFKYFVNNNPLKVSIEGRHQGQWISLTPETNVKAFAGNQKIFELSESREIDQVRVKTIPDGGINRLRFI